MEAKQEKYTIGDILQLRRNNMLAVNSEYQRGAVWTPDQKKKLIDSIFRGYPIPIIYLHSIKRQVGAKSRDDLEIIDGQQRINAIYEFCENAFRLYDPGKDLEKARFPSFLKDLPCPWAGTTFSELPSELQESLLGKELVIAEIESEDVNEVRDLFVRLQGGTALNAQERRDAWPGGFTEFILQTGGKPEIARYPGHRFFREVLGMKPKSDRGKTRQLAAQMFMLYDAWRKSGGANLCDTNASSINDFYYDHLDFDKKSELAREFLNDLTKISDLVAVGNLPKLRGHDAIHATILVDMLSREYSFEWEDKFVKALKQFLHGLSKGKSANDEGSFSEFWSEYGQRTRVNSDRADNIMRRHIFYQRKMLEFMAPLQLKDPNRNFGEAERSILFFEQDGLCQVCSQPVKYDEMEVHHVEPHSKGGQTILENGAIVHSACHPRSSEDVGAFKEKWGKRQHL